MLGNIYFKIAGNDKRIDYLRKKGAKIGAHCSISSKASFGSEPYLISIGNSVRITEGVHLITHDGGMWVIRNKYKEYNSADLIKKISIGDNVHIGINATILPGITIGSNVIIGVGSIVTKDIPDNSIAVGVPARIIENIDEYVEKHKHEYIYTKEMTTKEKRIELNKVR